MRQVHYALTRQPGSTPEWVAAIEVDGNYPGYMGHIGGRSSGTQDGRFDPPPFGNYREYWQEFSPSFNAHRVRTPILHEMHSQFPFLISAELGSVLRMQGKPVEQVWYPDGFHMLELPSERESAMQRAVDWFRFWLQNRERESVPDDPQRYFRWRALREQHRWNEQRISERRDPTALFLDNYGHQ